MDQNRRRIAWVSLALTAAVILAGCHNPTRDIPESGPVIDPCADRLHDISGHLLLYYSLERQLPQTLDELRAEADPGVVPPFTCPVSGKLYLYHPKGLQVPGRPGRLVLCDAAPTHSGMRWGIVITEWKTGGPLAARVILLSEELIGTAEPKKDPGTKNRRRD